jgi:hypothetical protein
MGLTAEAIEFAYVVEGLSYRDVMNGKHTNDWKNAMNEELNSFKTHNVYDIVPDPDTIPISCLWVFTEKCNNEGEIVWFKACIVARGFSQKAGIDYDQLFAPAIRLEAIRLLLSQAIIMEILHNNGILKQLFYMQTWIVHYSQCPQKELIYQIDMFKSLRKVYMV